MFESIKSKQIKFDKNFVRKKQNKKIKKKLGKREI